MKRWLRMLGAMWMLALLIWLPFEDTEPWLALALAAGACAWLFLRWNPNDSGRWRSLARGTLLGGAAPLLAVALMALKSGLHGHGFADFTLRQVWETITIIPAGLLAGAILGLAIGGVVGRKN